MKEKKILKTVMFMLAIFSYSYTSAQDDAQYTQYMYNTMTINPAYAGTRSALNVTGLHRTQWVGLEGAPTTNTVSINAPVAENMGLGLTVINDRIGPSTENKISIDYSYAINTATNYKIAFGLKGTANILDIDFSKLNIYDPADPIFQYSIDKKISPNIGVGAYVYSDVSYFGISIPNMLETSHFDKSVSDQVDNHIIKQRMHYYIMAGYVFDLYEHLDFSVWFKPAVLVKHVEGAPMQVDLSANFLFNEKFSAGMAYRLNSGVSAILGFQASDSWFIGYAYDAETTKLANYNSGSHEIFLRFELFSKPMSRMMSNRYF
ncbi:PorP/SprF family type IX secretion system membrane protein [Flavobacterium hercynium]|uniref:Type IX secretion system membrane protein PorP/SprF n=1 Tax=Flavobacterium hercynium TaxID=387094 RepID=A0A226GM09_9FLAO|nr:type IX secretion system membrane protein PorP/SprF [Flavobacterium hercynium]OXA83072.1 hypothetical protein B0A66_22600 [Flavobacterium hercynium]